MATPHADSASRKRLLLVLVPVLLAGVLADQASKTWAASRAVVPRALVPGYLVAYAVPNAGIVTGLGRGHPLTCTAFALLSLACIAWLARTAYRDRGRWRGADWLACALLVAGILGNAVDRLALGYVRDFLVTWVLPRLAFNVADLLVVVGIAGLFMARCLGVLVGRGEVSIGRPAPAGQSLSMLPL